MICRAGLADAPSLAILAMQLWHSHEKKELIREFEDFLRDKECALFLAFHRDVPIGFAQCQLRHDYVEGTNSSPVGYLEGIYVAEPHRSQGIARSLLAACEAWAKEMDCTEFASDCELTNSASLAFHLSAGFAEAGRIICFTKKL